VTESRGRPPSAGALSLDYAVNWDAISAIGQLVGALAVVISLIYLAREIRSNARATRRASMRSMSDALTRWLQQLSQHPQLRELYYRGIHDFESLEGADVVGFSALMVALFRNYEDMYFQQLEGVDVDVWRGFEAAIRDINGYPGVQAWWRSRSHWFTEEFAKVINQQQQTAKAPKLYRETNADQ
jgi:hypothetical protein